MNQEKNNNLTRRTLFVNGKKIVSEVSEPLSGCVTEDLEDMIASIELQEQSFFCGSYSGRVVVSFLIERNVSNTTMDDRPFISKQK